MKVIVMHDKAYKQLEKLLNDLLFNRIEEIKIDQRQITNLSNHIFNYTAHYDDLVEKFCYEEQENKND